MRTHFYAPWLVITACASLGAPSHRDIHPALPPALEAPFAHRGEEPPAVAALVSRFYGGGENLHDEIAAALKKYPGGAGVHEIAAYDAVLRGDDHVAAEHFMHALADLDAPAPEIYLWELSRLVATVSEHKLAMRLYEKLRREHPAPAVRQAATYYLAREHRRFAEREPSEALLGELGFLGAWQVIGPFDNDQGKGFLSVYPPEQIVDLDKAYTGSIRPVRWRKLPRLTPAKGIGFDDFLYPIEASVGYALTYVNSPRRQEAALRLTTGDAVRVWVNDEVVASEEKINGAELDDVVSRVTLEQGWNKVLIKSAHRSGGWWLSARLTGEDGAPLTGVATASEPHKIAAKTKARPGAPPPPIAELRDTPRGCFLEAQSLIKRRRLRSALSLLQGFLRDAPKNALAMYSTALALQDNDEAGQAIDLLNRGVESHPEYPVFLLERARYYAQKRLFDKAQSDLEKAAALNPSSYEAKLDLVDVLEKRGWTIDRCHLLEAAAARWPDDRHVRYALGDCQEDLGYVELAERHFLQARALEPGEPAALRRLVDIAMKRQDYARARELNLALAELEPTEIAHLMQEAEIWRRLHRPEEARGALERVIAQDPDWPRSYEQLAGLAYEARRLDEAEKRWREALARDPDNAQLAERIDTLAPATQPLADRYVPSAEDIANAVASADKITAHPASHVAVLLDHEVVTVNPDGSSRRVSTQVAKALTTEGRDALIQAQLPRQGKIKVLRAYSLKPDALKNAQQQEASSMTGHVLRFRGLEVGSIVVVQYVHYASGGRFLPNEYAQDWYFQQVGRQVEKSRWDVVIHRDRALNIYTRGSIDAKTETMGDWQVRSFTAAHVPPLVAEPHMPPARDLAAMVSVSTVKGWDDYVRWEMALLSDAFQTNAELEALAKRLTAGADTPRARLLKLWYYVAQEIRYQQDYEDTIAGVKPHSCPIVLERGYGDCKDKAVLLIRLARSVGLDLRFAILRTMSHGTVIKEIPNQQFNHAIVYVPKQQGVEQPFFIDPTTDGLDIENLRADDQGALSLVVDPQTGKHEFVEIPYQGPEMQYERHEIAVRVDATAKRVDTQAASRADAPLSARAEDRVVMRGHAAARIRLLLRNADGARKFYQTLASYVFSGANLLDAKAEHPQDVWQPLAIELAIDVTNNLHAQDDRFRLNVPALFSLERAAALSTREQPLFFGARDSLSVVMNIALPAGHVASHLPPDYEVVHPCFKTSRRSKSEGAKVVIVTEYQRTCAKISAQEYPAFRQAVQKVVQQSQEHVIFGPAPAKAPARKKVALSPRGK